MKYIAIVNGKTIPDFESWPVMEKVTDQIAAILEESELESVTITIRFETGIALLDDDPRAIVLRFQKEGDLWHVLA